MGQAVQKAPRSAQRPRVAQWLSPECVSPKYTVLRSPVNTELDVWVDIRNRSWHDLRERLRAIVPQRNDENFGPTGPIEWSAKQVACLVFLSQSSEWSITRLPMQERQVRSLSQEDRLEKGMATHSSILSWTVPRTEDPGGLQSVESQESDTTEPQRIHTQSSMREINSLWPDTECPYHRTRFPAVCFSSEWN